MKKIFVLLAFFSIIGYLDAEDPCNSCYYVDYQGGFVKDSPTGQNCYRDSPTGPDKTCGPIVECKFGFSGCNKYVCAPPCYSYDYTIKTKQGQ
jgi:hypothetical protein